jgi:hypothetical protein
MEERLAWKDQILRRIRAEFLEMPGMRLTLSQAKRLWGLDEQTCAQALELLITDRFLSRRADGTYTRLPDAPVPCPPRRTVKANLTTTPVQTPARGRS